MLFLTFFIIFCLGASVCFHTISKANSTIEHCEAYYKSMIMEYKAIMLIKDIDAQRDALKSWKVRVMNDGVDTSSKIITLSNFQHSQIRKTL